MSEGWANFGEDLRVLVDRAFPHPEHGHATAAGLEAIPDTA